MGRRAIGYWVIGAAILGIAAGCRSQQNTPPPSARQPTLKTEAELAQERQTRIATGEIVPVTASELPTTRPAAAVEKAPPPIVPAPGAIQPDILMVNDAVLTVAEVLYPLRDKINEARRTRTRRGFSEQVGRWVRSQTQQEIGSLLVYQLALSKLNDQQKEILEKAVKREMQDRIANEFGGSPARLEAHLAAYDLTTEKYKAKLQRDMLTFQYNKEELLPKVYVRRDELLDYYERNAGKFASPETRELWMIEAPFEKFLPPGTKWDNATLPARAQAKLQAVRHIRAAHAALAQRSFEDVAREYSRGPHAEDGGAWGEIGSPLEPPYEDASKKIFEFTAGQTSEPLELTNGWCIVKCGQIKAAKHPTFLEVQDELRATLREKKFQELAADYIMKLAEKATITAFDPFVATAVQRAGKDWGPPAGTAATLSETRRERRERGE